MNEEDVALLRRHEEAVAAQQTDKQISELAARCSWNKADFWKPFAGLRINFGETKVARPKYIVEFLPDGRHWWITLIASRDSRLPTGGEEVRVRLATLTGKNPRCPDGYSLAQQYLWRCLYDHFVTKK